MAKLGDRNQGSSWDGMERKKGSHGMDDYGLSRGMGCLLKFSVPHGMGLSSKKFYPMGWDTFKNFGVPSHPMGHHTSQVFF